MRIASEKNLPLDVVVFIFAPTTIVDTPLPPTPPQPPPLSDPRPVSSTAPPALPTSHAALCSSTTPPPATGFSPALLPPCAWLPLIKPPSLLLSIDLKSVVVDLIDDLGMWKLKAETFMAAMGQVKQCIS